MKLAEWVWSATEPAGERALRLGALLVGLPLLLAFLFFWHHAIDTPTPAPVASVERWIEPLAGIEFNTAGFAALAKRPADFSRATWENIVLPDVVPIAPIVGSDGHSPLARVWMRVRYTPPVGQPAPEQLAVYVTRVMGGAWSVWLDGRLVEVNLEDWRMQWNVPLYVKLPPGSLSPGRTMTIDVAFPISVDQGYAFGSLSVGEAAAIDRLFEMRVFWQCVLPKTSVVIVLLLGLISLHYWLGDRKDHAYLRLAFAAIVWAFGNAMYFGDFLDDDASQWFYALNNAAISWLVAAITLFVTQFDRDRWPRLEVGLAAYAGVVTVMTLPVWHWDINGLSLQYYVNALLTLSIFSYFSGRAFTKGSREFRVIMAAVLFLPLMALQTAYAVTAQRAPDAIDLYPFSAYVVFGAFLYVMQRRYLTARRSLEELNASLDQRLLERETELAEQHRKLMAIEQDRIVQQERQRIMRDMHDGIGTALMSSLALAERGELSPARTAAILRDSLDELKMVIDSLEPIGEDIATLLASLRYRFGQRIEDAGLHIVWDMGDLPPLPWLDPSHALQVLRIVQESFANVIKHAQASEIHIGAHPAVDEAGRPLVVVVVADNGIGFDPAHARRGRGLGNLRRRAADLGATIDIRSEPGHGASISLRLSVDRA
ncbi:sensor histidine kinase [Telmatospirillum sp.]|uniref:sensor histidine kinase n=1 Tax=Telmatospirillum sp. TaxID=2079197 RepID=UPI002846C23D|nr:sensor histidine kinase [Telmatospirillum sp.]MDR3440507.1 sensor histidine kinase [Telmatospirillum sp.]